MIRILVAVAAVLACASCTADSSTGSTSSASDSTASSPKAPAANGEEISGTGYSFNVPQGWGQPSQKIPGFDFDSFAVDLRDKDGFSDNVNVLLSPAGTLTPQQAEDAAENELSAIGADDISVNDRVVVDGGESPHVTAVMSMNDTEYTIEQFYPSKSGQTVVVTFSFSKSVAAGERASVTDATLASWAWKN